MRKRVLAAGLVVAALCLSAGSGVFGAPAVGVVPLEIGERAVYDFTSTTYTPGREDHEDGSFSLVRGKKGAVQFDFLPEGGLNETFPTVLQHDGTLDLDITVDNGQPPFVLQRLNQIANLLNASPAAPKTGDTWKTKVNVPLPRAQSVDVPVVVRVSAASDAGFDLEATGEIRTRLLQAAPSTTSPVAPAGGEQGALSEDPGLPLTLSLHMTAHFLAGRLDKADGTLNSTVQARDLIEITSKWALAAHKTAQN